MSTVNAPGKLEGEVISHMGSYYHWRWGRTERQRKAVVDLEKLVRQGQAVAYATPDDFMSVTDREWERDVQNIAQKRTGHIRSSTTPLEDTIYDAWRGTLRKSIGENQCKLFDEFFDRYVHDSIAGFKNQMTDSGVGMVEASRWARNRQYFLGKRGGKFLYWRYEGENPAVEKAKLAAMLRSGGEQSDNISSPV